MMDAEELFDFVIRRHRVEVYHDRLIKNASHLTVTEAYCVLSIRHDLTPAQRREAIAVQLVRLMLGHIGKRSAWRPEYRIRRDWLEALRLAAEYLIPRPLILLAEREEWTVAQLADEAQVPYRLALVRLADYLARKRGVPFFTYVPDIRVLAQDEVHNDWAIPF